MPYITGLIATIVALLALGCSWASESLVTSAMTGHWEGNARIVVSWCRQTILPVKVDINADGSVNGTIGDALLNEGHFQSNRGWLERKLNLATDYIITGNLEGSIIAAEGIVRKRVMMPLDFKEDSFTGSVNTKPLKFLGRDFAAGFLTLIHPR